MNSLSAKAGQGQDLQAAQESGVAGRDPWQGAGDRSGCGPRASVSTARGPTQTRHQGQQPELGARGGTRCSFRTGSLRHKNVFFCNTSPKKCLSHFLHQVNILISTSLKTAVSCNISTACCDMAFCFQYRQDAPPPLFLTHGLLV